MTQAGTRRSKRERTSARHKLADCARSCSGDTPALCTLHMRREQWHSLAPGEASVSAPQPDTSWPTAFDPVRVKLNRYVQC